MCTGCSNNWRGQESRKSREGVKAENSKIEIKKIKCDMVAFWFGESLKKLSLQQYRQSKN